VNLFRVALALVAVLGATAPVHALLRISPAIIETTFDNGRTSGSFVITNTSDATLRVRATPVYFRLTPDGQIKQCELDKNALTSWMKITPREFPLSGKAERQIRYAIVAPDSVPVGSYWGGIEFLPVPSHSDSVAAQSQIRGIAAVLVPVFVEKGKPASHWSLLSDSLTTEVTPQGVQLMIPVRNDGDARVPQSGNFEIRNSAGAVVKSGEMGRLSIFPNSTRFLRTTLPPDFPAGTYECAFTLKAETDGSTLSGSMKFDVPSELPKRPTKGARRQ
jgi:hypothetical protein